MQYPLISEYVDAIRSAEDNFDKLNGLRPVLDNSGNPVMSSGNFAVVFKMKDVKIGKLYAVKCFTREQEGRAEAYKQISEAISNIDKSSYLLSVTYYEKELFVDSTQTDETEFPVLLMDWVDGLSLDAYTNKISDNKIKLEQLADNFQELVCWLLMQSLAHGDLKPDNILVKDDGSIILLDYDGMYVPSMAGQFSRENGTPFYKHPLMKKTDFNSHIDDYAALKILLILKAMAVEYRYYDAFLKDDSQEFISQFLCLSNNKQLSIALAAFIIVNAEGCIEPQKIHCLLFGKQSFFNRKKDIEDNSRIIHSIESAAKFYAKSNDIASDFWHGIYLYASNRLSGCYSITPEIFSLWKNSAEQGFAVAQNSLGVDYTTGQGVPQDYEKAVFWYTKAAEQGIAAAQNNLGICYAKGQGVPQDYEKAVYWYTKAAEQGYAVAQNNLGVCYAKGQGVPQDYEKAVFWYTKAAEQGIAAAQNNLGVCYAKGQGVPQDYEKTVFWYTKAAEQGIAVAQKNLGASYANGQGVPQDYEKAVYWFSKAAEQGNATAQSILGEYYHKGKGVNQDYGKSLYWFTKAAEQGNAGAQYNLGFMYKNGIYVPQDNQKAVYWFTKAAEQGLIIAQVNLGLCFYKGLGVIKNYKKMVYWLTKAAEQGYAVAQISLGLCYAKGQGVPQDYEKAVYWYTQAAEQGNAEAQNHLGLCYAIGEGVKRDNPQAFYWFSKAAEQGNKNAKKYLSSLRNI